MSWQLNLLNSESRFGFVRDDYEDVCHLADELIAFKTDNQATLTSYLEEMKKILNFSFSYHSSKENSEVQEVVQDIAEIPLYFVNLILYKYGLKIEKSNY